MNIQVRIPDLGLDGVLTTEHAASSYGYPVLLFHKQAHGPGEVVNGQWLGQIELHPAEPISQQDRERATAAGWWIGDGPHSE